MRHLWAKLCLVASLALALLCAPSAYALTLQEIVVMSGQGVSDDVIVAILSGSDDVPVLTDADRAMLRQSGVSERVITALDDRRKSAPVVAEEIPGVPGSGTILAPVEASNAPIVFRKFFSDAAETYAVQSEIARETARLQDENDSVHALDGDVPKVLQWTEQAQRMPVQSLESCMALLEERQPTADSPIATALYQCIGHALDALDAPAMAAVYLDMALTSGARVHDIARTMSAYLRVAHVWGYTSQDPVRIKDHAREVDEGRRPEFLYLTAYSLVYGPKPDVTQAAQILQNVEPGTVYYARARILLATLAVRAPAFRFKTAAEYLHQALQSLDGDDGREAAELRDTAWLTLGRIAFENHAYEQAHAFYGQVALGSHHLREAFLEDAWGQLFAGRHAEALAITHALRAPVFAKAWLPDAALIEAGAYLGLCRYEQAQRTLDAFRAGTLAEAAALQRYVARTPKHDFYNQVVRHAAHDGESPIPEGVYHRILSDFSFQMLHRAVRRLTDERRTLGTHAGSSFASWPKLAATYDGQIARYQELLNERIAAIYDDVQTELHALDISASQIAIEIRLAQRRREAECLQIVAAGGRCEAASGQDARSLDKGASDAYWDFDGEFWRDELRHYVSGMTSLCVGTTDGK